MILLLSFAEEKLAVILERFLPHYLPDITVIRTVDATADIKEAVLLTDDLEIAETYRSFPFLLFGSSGRDAPIDISLPFRAGMLIDRLHSIINGPVTDLPSEVLSIGPYHLDMHDGRLMPEIRGEKEALYLTEKERAILYVLYEAHGKTVGRKRLLSRVWEYADNVETHTLETHIYRLRQKIEDDPSSPRLLITDNDGYFLKIDSV